MPSKLSILFLLALLVLALIYGVLTGTLSYPYIIASRQVQLIKHCAFGSLDFSTEEFKTSFTVPEGYCVLPNRLFPADANVQVLPKDWYFAFNEYAKGTVAASSLLTAQFEKVTAERDPERIIETLISGQFLDPANISSTTIPGGITFTLADSVLGADGKRYDWALATHPNGKYFVEVISPHPADRSVRDHVLSRLRFAEGQ